MATTDAFRQSYLHHHFRAEIPDDLLATQAPALRIFLRHYGNIVYEVLEEIKANQHAIPGIDIERPHRVAGIDIERPHRVFCVDGGRGSGKTYTLLSLDHALDQLTNYIRGRVDSEWKNFFEGSIADPALKRLQVIGETQKTLAHVLQIIFPGDLEGDESVMETIFAAMGAALERRKKIPEASEKAKSLANELRENVAEGWYFARHFGHEAIIRDSIDYKDFVEQFERESHKSAHRIGKWRAFVDKYLDFHDAITLVVLLDDSDVQPELAQNILHSIRMFLNHPRVVTVLAGNIRAMRDNLLHLAMRRISSSSRALNQADEQTARDWRRQERRAIEEYLEKVLPPAQRFFLRPPELRRGETLVSNVKSNSPKVLSDFKKIAGKDLLEICWERLEQTREIFLRAKFRLALKREVSLEDAPTVAQYDEIEDFLSWWVFANRYADTLAPKSARQIGTFRQYYVDAINAQSTPRKKGLPKLSVKRLSVMLHDVPENFSLIQRLTDDDASFANWLRQQALESVWVGQRMFRINKRKVLQGTYSYDYIRYRLDVGLGMPFRTNAEEDVPSGLLPPVRGRRHMRRFFQPRNMPRQQRRYGVARLIDHAAIPSNCAYFSDLGVLPDISLISEAEQRRLQELQRGGWEDQLAGRWVDLLEEEQDELLVRYFTEVICARLRKTKNISSASLMHVLNPLVVGKDLSLGLYETLFDFEIATFGAGFDPNIFWEAMNYLEMPEKSLAGQRSLPLLEPPTNQATRLVALTAALVTDLRRAWHAVRIHEMSPRWMESGESAGDAPQSERTERAIKASQTRMQLFDREKLERTLRKSDWLSSLMDTLQLTNLTAAINKATDGPAIDRYPDQAKALAGLFEQLEAIFDLARADSIKSQLSDDEDKDYERWADTLRRFGRAVSADWPVYYETEKTRNENGEEIVIVGGDTALCNVDLEGFLAEQERTPAGNKWILDISDKSKRLARVKFSQLSEAFEDLKRGRDVRKFVWLMAGIAPNLPAIIHSNIMARVYEAETIIKSHGNAAISSARVVDLYKGEKGAVKELEAWYRLIGCLAVSIRYVKIKCLHLFAKLFVDAALFHLKGAGQETMDEYVKFFEHCKIHVPNDRDAVTSLFVALQEKFGADISKNLAMMPDVAPATLFGEEWMIDLVRCGTVRTRVVEELGKVNPSRFGLTKSEEYLRPPEDKALNVRGMFGETEQWLWAANRFVRKLNNIIVAHWEKTKAKADDQAPRT